MNPITNIGAFRHPQFGEFYLWHDETDDTFGISRVTKTPPTCSYPSLTALFKAKGL